MRVNTLSHQPDSSRYADVLAPEWPRPCRGSTRNVVTQRLSQDGYGKHVPTMSTATAQGLCTLCRCDVPSKSAVFSTVADRRRGCADQPDVPPAEARRRCRGPRLALRNHRLLTRAASGNGAMPGPLADLVSSFIAAFGRALINRLEAQRESLCGALHAENRKGN